MGTFKDDFVEVRFNAVKYKQSQDDNKSIKFITNLKQIKYLDKNKVAWYVPEGFESDGVSSRNATQWVSGEPFEGDTLRAALVHDVYCKSKERSQKATHKVFEEILKQDGVGWLVRKAMHRAVVIWNKIKNPDWK